MQNNLNLAPHLETNSACLAWVKERLRKGLDGEIRSVLGGLPTVDANRVEAVLRMAVEEQTFQIGDHRYHSSLFCVPVLLEIPPDVSERPALLIDKVLPLLLPVFPKFGLTEPKEGVVLLNQIVPTAALRGMCDSDLFDLGSALFSSSIVGWKTGGRTFDSLIAAQDLKDGGFSSIPDGMLLSGHLVGVRYGKTLQATPLKCRRREAAEVFQQILEYQLSTLDVPVKVHVSPPVPLYRAIEDASLIQFRRIIESMRDFGALVCPNESAEVRIVSSSDGRENKLKICQRHGGATIWKYSLDLSERESRRLGEIVRIALEVLGSDIDLGYGPGGHIGTACH